MRRIAVLALIALAACSSSTKTSPMATGPWCAQVRTAHASDVNRLLKSLPAEMTPPPTTGGIPSVLAPVELVLMQQACKLRGL